MLDLHDKFLGQQPMYEKSVSPHMKEKAKRSLGRGPGPGNVTCFEEAKTYS